jgi:hypothetical protein
VVVDIMQTRRNIVNVAKCKCDKKGLNQRSQFSVRRKEQKAKNKFAVVGLNSYW